MKKQELINIIRESVRNFLNENNEEPFTPDAFFGRWFLSKKNLIPDHWYFELYKKYPYSGRSYRIDTSLYDKPYASWCKTVDGLRQWKYTMNPLGQTPANMHNYIGDIEKGIDLAAFVKDNIKKFKESGQLIIDVEEVIPITKVKNIIEL